MTTAMREKSKTPIAKALSMLLVLFAIVECCSMMMPAEAHASEMAHLTSGGRINYAGYYTTWFDVDGEVAYCGNPSASTPKAAFTRNGRSRPQADVTRRRWPIFGLDTAALVSISPCGPPLGMTAAP